MNGYTGNGQVLGAVVSVLPATTAYFLIPGLQSNGFAISLLAIFALWGVSYLAVNKISAFVGSKR